MKINAVTTKPVLTEDEVDVYLVRGKKALELESQNPIGLWRIFQRHTDARFFGREEFLFALASLVNPADRDKITIHSVPEGHALGRHETAMTLVGPARSLIVVETLLHYLSTGTRFRTLAADFPGTKYPWAFMGARYLAREDLALATRALSEEEILSTVPALADKFIGTESHSQIALWGGLSLDQETEEVIANVTSDAKVAATIRATVAFARANPGIPLYVLGDFAARSVGCFEVFRATSEACRQLDLELIGGRMDISRCDLSDQALVDKEFDRWACEENRYLPEGYPGEGTPAIPGMSPQGVKITRELLDKAGMKEFKLVVSSGIKLEAIESYVQAGAGIVGIGEEAAYYLNKGECNFTADVIGYFRNDALVPFAKEGREIERIASADILVNARPGFALSANLERVDFRGYF